MCKPRGFSARLPETKSSPTTEPKLEELLELKLMLVPGYRQHLWVGLQMREALWKMQRGPILPCHTTGKTWGGSRVNKSHFMGEGCAVDHFFEVPWTNSAQQSLS